MGGHYDDYEEETNRQLMELDYRMYSGFPGEMKEKKFKEFNTGAQKDKQVFSSGAQKDTAGKPRFDLIPPEAMKALAETYTLGADKYTRKMDLTLENLQLCVPIVKKLQLFIVKAGVDHATKKIYEILTQNFITDSSKTEIHGQNETQTKLKQLLKNGRMIHIVDNEINELNGLENLKSLDLQKNLINNYVQKDAQYVDLPDFYILTTTIKTDTSEESYVVIATSGLGSLEILLKGLKEQLNISSLPYINGRNLILSGDRNWEKGIPFSVAIGALKRHLNEFELGNKINTADGNLEHLAHVMWWAVALVTFSRRNRNDLNDLPAYKEKAYETK